MFFITRKKNVSLEPAIPFFYGDDKKLCSIRIGNGQSLGKREQQQDCFGLSDIKAINENNSYFMAIVSDGMGGLKNGADISRQVVSFMLTAFMTFDCTTDIPLQLEQLADQLNIHITENLNSPSEQGGATLACVVLHKNHLYFLSIGDSRIYLFRNKMLYVLTQDHNYKTYVNHQYLKGNIEKTAIFDCLNQNGLTSYIGINHLADIDQNKKAFTLQKNDKIMLCSDGVYNTVSENDMMDSLQYSAVQAAEDMICKINCKNMNGQDNSTVIVIEYF